MLRFPDGTRSAREALAHCQAVAAFSEDSHHITRTFLSGAAGRCQAYLTRWMEQLGMQVRVDAAGNLRGLYPASSANAKRILLGSHLDTVPDAGAYDGVLGVVLAISLVETLAGERLPFAIEVIGFSEEEGVRFGVPFIGSKALIGALDERTLQSTDGLGISVEAAIRNFGLDPRRLPDAVLGSDHAAYLEFHIEQGPVLESLAAPLGVVEAIVGQSRARVSFGGKANHAGTTPMNLRRDALCAAASWVLCVERQARETEGLVATVGKLEVKPGAPNAVPGEVTASLDVRHAGDAIRCAVFQKLLQIAGNIARQRGLVFESTVLLDQPAVAMDRELTQLAEEGVCAAGVKPHRMTSGAGHDAMILASSLRCAMIFLRSPEGISHHPDESVLVEDVELALLAGLHLLHKLSTCPFLT